MEKRSVMKAKQKLILFVEDDMDDREFLSEAFKELNPEVEIVHAENGVEALNYLEKMKSGKNAMPCLIVLDINMPLLDGKETLMRIREDQKLQQVPVVVFTSSESPYDKSLFNSLGIELITKPNNICYLSGIASHMLSVCDSH
jgi:CheY-like chemotaxis protein